MRCAGHFDPQDSAPTPRCEQSIRIELPASTWATCWGAFFPLYVHLGSCLVHPMPCVQDRHGPAHLGSGADVGRSSLLRWSVCDATAPNSKRPGIPRERGFSAGLASTSVHRGANPKPRPRSAQHTEVSAPPKPLSWGRRRDPPTPPHSTSSPSVRRKDAVGVAAASSPGAAGTQALGVCGVQAGSS